MSGQCIPMPTGIIITGVAHATRKAFAFAYFKAKCGRTIVSGERAKRASAFINEILSLSVWFVLGDSLRMLGLSLSV